MTTAALAIVLFVALGAVAVVFNHIQARLALVELALNEGLPPGYQRLDPLSGVAATSSAGPTVTVTNPSDVLPVGLHVFLSRNCHACQRLVDELDQARLEVGAPLHLRYVDRPRPIAAAAAVRQGATLHEHQNELAAQVHADPLPFTVGIGEHGLASRAVTPTVRQVLVAARDAGITARLDNDDKPIEAS